VTTALGRRRVAIWAVTASREIYWPLVALPFLPLSREGRLSVLIAVAAISAVLAVIGNNAWTAWMGALVPDKLRGRYFGRRTAICTLGGTTASLLSGSILDLAGASHLEGVVYSLLAAVAAISGIVTAFLLAQQHEPEPQPGVAPTLSLEALRAPLRDPAARRYLAYLVAWNAAVGLAGPLFSIHMLENLKMGFLLMGLQVAGVAAVRFLAVPLWGRALDKVGSRPVLLACSFGISIVPLVWLFPRPGALWPIALDSLLSGVLWSGHGLASFALPLSLAPKSQRPFYLATFSAAGGLAFGTAATLGGAIAEHLPRDILVAGQPMFGLQELFVASALLRLIAAVIGLRVVEPGARSIEQLVQMGTRYLVRLPLRLTQEVLARR
jgi:MFS family permease